MLTTETILPIIDQRECILCGLCIDACPADALTMGVDGPEFKNPNVCTYCTECESICPEKAISCPLQIIWNEDI